MSWFTLAIISVLSISVSTLLQRVLMKKEDSNPIASAILFQFLSAGYVFIFAISLGKFIWPTDQDLYPRFILSAFLWAGTTYFSFKAFKLLETAEATIIISSNALVTITLGVFLLKEILTIKIISGIILILGSILVVNSQKLNFKSRKGIVFALFTALFSGIAVINDVYILKNYEVFSFTAIMSLLPGVILLTIFSKEIPNVKKLIFKKDFRIMLILTFFYSIQAVAFYLAYQKGAPISTLSTLTKSSIILTVTLAVLFLKERTNLAIKGLAALMVTIGAILLS